MTFGERLRTLRHARGLTLKELAQMVGVSEATMDRYESGAIATPPARRLPAMAEALAVTQTELLGLADEEPLDAEVLSLARDLQRMPERQRNKVMEMLRLLMDQEQRRN